VILAAVTMAWRDHVQLLGKVEVFYQSELNRLLAQLEAIRPTGLIAYADHAAKRKEVQSACSNLDKLIAMLKQRLRTTEAAILCLGTFIWGYGSPIGNFLWRFS
jgi:hypothetical protein